MIKELKEKYDKTPVQLKAGGWFLICTFFQTAVVSLTTPIFTRLMTTEEYGQFSAFYSWLEIIQIFATLNLSSAMYGQGLIKFKEERNIFSSSLQGLTTTLILVWTVLYLIFHQFWNDRFKLTTVQMLSMLVMIWATAVFGFWAGEQRVLYRYRTLVRISLPVSFAMPLVGILFVICAKDKVTARILGMTFVQLIGYSGLYVIQMCRGKKFFSKRFWKYALLYNLPLIPHYLSLKVLNSADRIMIRDMIGDGEAGIYSLAYSVALIMTFFNTALSQTIDPWLFQKIKDRRIQDIAPVSYISLGIVAVCNIILILCAPEIVAIFAPKPYYDAIWIIPPVAMSAFFMYSYGLFSKFAFYFEKTVFIMLASVIGAVTNVLLNYICIQRFGYVAAGYTTLVCYILYSVCHYIFMTIICRQFADGIKPYKLVYLLGIAVPFVLLGFMLLLTYEHPIIRYTLMAVCFVLIFVFRKKLFVIADRMIRLNKVK